MTPAGAPLFDVDLPSGFHYRAEFISAGEEAALAVEIGRLEFSTFEMRGVVARRRVASAYLMAGESRNAYEHHIPAGASLRYSITFRTLRP